MPEFTKTRFNSITHKAKYQAQTFGLGVEESEDFSQWAALKLSTGRKASVYQLLLDYMDNLFGAPEDLFHEEKRNLQNATRGDFNSEEFCNIVSVNSDRGYSRQEPTLTSLARECQNNLEGVHRAVFTFLCHGYTLLELGDAFGVSESRIGQYVMEIKKTLRASQPTNISQ